uniref:Retrotransposon gag domain-containing protein n=1 Tax=Fagus sylvatica TaxID=28930 RepID=A0A2N9HG49_FAGSY
MMGETSGPSAQDIRMASFEEKFNDLLNFVRLLVKRDTESEKQVEDIDKGTSEDNTGGHSDTNLGPPPVQPSKPEERDFQLDAKVEKTMRSTKMVDASALLALAKPDVENEARTVDPNVAPENDPSPKGNWNTLEGPSVSYKYGHSSKGSKESEKEAQSPISKKEEPKEVDHPMIPHKRLISPVFLKQSPHLLHDSSKKCEFHFGRPGHSLEDCHALKNKVQDLVDHGILRINEGSTPSVIIAWPPEHCKDETVIPSPQSQGPTTCGIQPVHLTMLPTLSEVGEHTVPKTQPKLMSNFRNLDDQCSLIRRKPNTDQQMHDTQTEDTRAWLGQHLALAPMGHQEIRQSEPFQGAPEPGSRIAKDEFSRPRHHHHRRGRSTH